MKVSAIVLAGAPNSGKLAAISPEPHEALIPLKGKPLVDWVVGSLVKSETVAEIIVVGPVEDLKTALGEDWPEKGKIIPSGDSLLENLERGAKAASKEELLIVTSDIPLISAATIDDFVKKAQAFGVDACYPIVTAQDTQKAFPQGQRTFIKLKDGTFTGGNLIYLKSKILAQTHDLFAQVIAARKKPWQLVKILGVSFIFSFLFKQLSIERIEKRALELGIHARGLILEDAAIGFDVDKPLDLEQIEKAIEELCE